MGGGQSTPGASTAETQPPSVGMKVAETNNNQKGDIVIIPVDPSKQAETAFEWYVAHIHRPENVVRVLHCPESPNSGPFFPEHTFKRYFRHAHKPNNYVRVLHCQEYEHPDGENYPDYAVPPEAFVEQYEKAHKSGTEIAEKYEKKMQEYGIQGSVQREVGRPGEVIIHNVDKHNASMIVMGSRGFGVVRRTILGSVSEYVIHHTKVPVTVIPRETQSWFF